MLIGQVQIRVNAKSLLNQHIIREVVGLFGEVYNMSWVVVRMSHEWLSLHLFVHSSGNQASVKSEPDTTTLTLNL